MVAKSQKGQDHGIVRQPAIQVEYKGKIVEFSPEEISAIVLSLLQHDYILYIYLIYCTVFTLGPLAYETNL